MFAGQKLQKTTIKLKSKKSFLGKIKNRKRLKLGPHRGPIEDSSATWDKKISGVKNNQIPRVNGNQKTFSRGRSKTGRKSKWDPIANHLRMVPPGVKIPT